MKTFSSIGKQCDCSCCGQDIHKTVSYVREKFYTTAAEYDHACHCLSNYIRSLQDRNVDLSTNNKMLLTHQNALELEKRARIERNAKGIERMFAAMCELDTPKRGELHLLLISLFS